MIRRRVNENVTGSYYKANTSGALGNMTYKKTLRLLATTLLLACVSTAHATLVNFTLTGNVTFDLTFGGTNAFGLIDGDPVTATGSFDDSLIGGNIISGSGTIDVSAITNLVITVGSQTFTDLDDNGSGLLTIVNGTAIDGIGSAGFVYAGTNSNTNIFTSNASDDFIGNSDVLGVWNGFAMTAVPVPAAVWLFGSGLIGLAGVARRKKVSA